MLESFKHLFGFSNSPVPRLSFATRFDTKLREKSFEKQNSALPCSSTAQLLTLIQFSVVHSLFNSWNEQNT